MSAVKLFRTPAIVTLGVLMTVAAFAGPASAADSVYPPQTGTGVLGTTVTVPSVQAAPATASAGNGLAFTGSNALGAGALGGLLLVGGAAMVVVGKRRKVNA